MGRSFRWLRFAHVLLITFALSARFCGTSESESNDATISTEDDEEDSQPEISLEEFKERYRRLIPYMTFYVASNYVNGQTSPARNYLKGPSANSLPRRPQHSAGRPIHGLSNGDGNYRVPAQSDDKKFVPSVQYDPRNIGADNDFFSPLRYGAKVNYADHLNPYRLYQGQKQVYPAFTTPSARFSQENRYYTTVRPLRPYSSHTRDQLPRKQAPKAPVHVTVSDDYLLDYIIRPSVKTANPNLNYPAEEFEGLRYVPPTLPKPTTVSDLPAAGPSSAILSGHRNPNVNLNHILEGFRLTERLPEMLNNGNLDSSLKTLVEILSILHGAGKEEFPQHRIPGQPFPSAGLRIPSKLGGYDDYKVRYTRPKVITETRFQATPSPLFLAEDPERFKSTGPLHDGKPKTQLLANYNGLNEEKIIEYYTPYVQDIPDGNKEVLKPTARPQNEDISTEHSYEITEDLSDDILQDERFTLPITTEAPISSQPTPHVVASTRKPISPQPSLKYGVTRGKPNVDYPAYASIPETDFSCKEQRYKGFFGDPSTGCQVWHYCDLNGGKSSFLCPNGTIFSQVALTCDWWFNVKCESTTQLYVLNERLYKYILPIMPKFPEDFTGPEVDRYLEIKFKEMEAKLKEKKLKKQQEGKEKIKEKLQKLSNHADAA